MDAERIKAIIELTKASGACEIALETPEGAIRVRRRPRVAGGAHAMPAPEAALPQLTVSEAQPEPALEPKAHIVRAANVGWFHRGPGPETQPLVQVGDHVKTKQPLGTVETLKMLNQVTSEVEGEIREVLVEDGEEVEYGQPLFVIVRD